MQVVDYIVVGGGAAGIGALSELRDAGETSVMLVEGRDTLGYTLSWMEEIPFGAVSGATYTGTQFREEYLQPVTRDPAVRLGHRVFAVDLEQRVVHVTTPEQEHEKIGFSHLIVAVGAVQVLFGRHLLPGRRTNRMFTTYQVGEMLAHYPFQPGHNVIFYGSSPYLTETVRAAQRAGIATTVVSPDEPAEADYPHATLSAVRGEGTFSGVKIEQNGAHRELTGDALVVDGDFVLERQWREMLGVRWELEAAQTTIPADHPQRDVFTLIGDAAQPDPDFVRQYERARNVIREVRPQVTA
ncbi:MAG: FAD-dependent oxidoreductase [Alkalispirochaeta sp.]